MNGAGVSGPEEASVGEMFYLTRLELALSNSRTPGSVCTLCEFAGPIAQPG